MLSLYFTVASASGLKRLSFCFGLLSESSTWFFSLFTVSRLSMSYYLFYHHHYRSLRRFSAFQAFHTSLPFTPAKFSQHCLLFSSSFLIPLYRYFRLNRLFDIFSCRRPHAQHKAASPTQAMSSGVTPRKPSWYDNSIMQAPLSALSLFFTLLVAFSSFCGRHRHFLETPHYSLHTTKVKTHLSKLVIITW